MDIIANLKAVLLEQQCFLQLETRANASTTLKCKIFSAFSYNNLSVLQYSVFISEFKALLLPAKSRQRPLCQSRHIVFLLIVQQNLLKKLQLDAQIPFFLDISKKFERK